MPRSRRYLLIKIIASLLLMLGACAGHGPGESMLGNSREQVLQLLGEPSTELTIPQGKVMIYPRGPFGKRTYFVYLNHHDFVERWTQVLEEKNFALINPGMHRDDVVATIGPSRDTVGLARDRGYVWNYRYLTPHCLWFQIEFSSNDTVRSTGYGRPPECRVRAVAAGG
jgi:hypothetical protein